MSSFSQLHAPEPRPLGPEIPVGVRRAIASWFRERGIDPQQVRQRFFQLAGYGGAADVVDDVRDRWGHEQASLLHEALDRDPSVSQYSYGPNRMATATQVVHLHLPAPLYLDYLEEAVRMYVQDFTSVDADDFIEDPRVAPVQYLNELFATRRIDYRFNEGGRATWHGDEGAYHAVIRPALDAAADERLVGCREEFEAALGHLRAGTPKDREDAIEEAGKAVESAMKVVLDTREVDRPERQTAEPLWQAIRDAGIVETPTHDSIVSTSRLRNEWGGHGQGGEIRDH